ncbi:MAG: T9SS C-terminal target domain-containing protein [Chitinophagaceae bacterium]|nr:MAG: T9SS C-terminal target domain-containing protein [Chitinophagaceae bacterium]
MISKIILLSFSLILYSYNLFAQFEQSLECQQNANSISDFNLLKKATFRFNVIGIGRCTGVLINRDEEDDDLGYYFVTNWHCFKTGTNCGGDEFDFENNTLRFMFNFQSPNSDDISTAVYNRGPLITQSIAKTGDPESRGFGYYHESQVELIKKVSCVLGDFALLRIIDPIPPHFDVAHAGWLSGPFILPSNLFVHHPRGDIKKLSTTSSVYNVTSNLAVSCYVVTAIIDFFFGWAYSTQVVCSYIEWPFYAVQDIEPGPIQGGSSGSGMFNFSERLVGNASATWPDSDTCSGFWDVFHVSKFRNIYPRNAIRSKLNPSKNWMVDQFGLQNRKIDCHSSLEDIYGYYFPAQDYQAENKIYIRSKAEITTNDPSQNDNPGVIIFEEAHYEYHATTFIELNPGFDAQPGSSFVAEINPCNSTARKAAPEIEYPPIRVLNRSNLEVIERKSKHSRFSFYPNPANSHITINFSHPPDEIAQQIVITDFSGRKVFDITTENNVNAKTLNIENLDNGTYFLTLVSNKSTYSDKLVIVR